MAEKLEDKILKWIQKDGYPLQVKASRILSSIGFTVGQSIFFPDPDTNDTRVIDIVAYKNYKVKDNWITFTFVIECRSSLDNPWIAFFSKEKSLKPNDFIKHLNTNNRSKEVLVTLANDNMIHDLELFRITDGIAFNLKTAFSEDDTETFNALMSVKKATSALVEKGNQVNNVYRFFFPTILIDGKLFDYHMDTTDKLILSEKENIKLLISNSLNSKKANFIDLITLEGFEKRMKQFSSDIEFIMQEFESEF